jgi:uncharacterized protein (DUF885 family)
MGTSHDTDFEKLAENFARFLLKTYPVSATQIGVHDWDEDLGDYTPSGLKTKQQRLAAFKKSFKAVNRRMLTPDNRADLDLIQGRIEVELLMQTKWPQHELLPDLYLNEILFGVYVLISREFGPIRERAIAATRRLAQAPNLLKQARKLLKNPPQVFVESALHTCAGAKVFFKSSLPDFASQLRGALKDALLEVNDEFIVELDSFAEYLETSLLPDAKANFAMGKTLYNQMLKHNHQLTESSDQLLKLANSQIKRYEAELTEVAAQISKKKDWRVIIEDIKKDHPSTQGLAAAYKKEIKSARAFLIQQDLVTIPEGEDLEVVVTPTFAKPLIPYAAYLAPAPLDELQKGTFWVSTPSGMTTEEAAQRLRGHCKWVLPLIALHEGYPGHHLQIAKANQQKRLVRHLIGTPVLTEGWAFYCEDMMFEQGFLDNPRQRLFQLKDALFRALRVIIDVGLQSKTLNITQAIKMLVEKANLEEPHAEAEVRRYCQSPTQPMSFLVGKLQIDALLADYKKARGSAFSLKEFHDELLSFGALPPSQIRTLMGL